MVIRLFASVALANPLSGFICLSLPPSRLSALSLPPLLPPSGVSQDPKGTAYHLTLDANPARHPITTGISAHDRAYVARLLADETKGEEEFTRPGHLVTLRYRPGGVRERRGHTECAVGECEVERGEGLGSSSCQAFRRHFRECGVKAFLDQVGIEISRSFERFERVERVERVERSGE
jgi:hypothetical protein